MAARRSTGRILFACGVFFGGAVGAQLALRQLDERRPSLLALALRPAREMFPSEQRFTPQDVEKLLTSVKYDVRSPAAGFAPEPSARPGLDDNVNLSRLGFGRSRFLVDSKWATIRFLGPSPAGRGMSDEELEMAQMEAFGKPNDTTPVVTAVAAINEMMDEYFVPLLAGLPGGRDILSKIKVQGAYFSPEYIPPENEDEDPSNDSYIGRDNAFVVGLQALEIFPHGCFLEGGEVRDGCEPPFFSSGHDPTIMGHELGHVLFNHMRGAKSLEGFQWFAVNEGYADYFSAAHFKDPYVGRIWKVDQKSSPFLRRLVDSPKVGDEAYAHEIHAFSVVWSSALWKVRTRLVKEKGAAERDVDRSVLFSIAFLGETDKTRLGDAATALLRAAESLGFPQWKAIMREEFEQAEVRLKSPRDAILVRRGPDVVPGSPVATACGVVGAGNKSSTGSTGSTGNGPTKPGGSTPWWPLAAPLVLVAALRWRKSRRESNPLRSSGFRAIVVACLGLGGFGGLGSGCQKKEEAISSPGYTLAYACDTSTIDLKEGPENVVYFTWYEPTASASPVQRILVSGKAFERSPGSIIVVVDKERMRLEQVRTRDGKPLELSMRQTTMTELEALPFKLVRVANLVLDTSASALASARGTLDANTAGTPPNESRPTAPSAKEAAFRFDDITYVALAEENVKGGFGYGPLASKILRTGISGEKSTACRLDPSRSSR
jgi:hypothetical protein